MTTPAFFATSAAFRQWLQAHAAHAPELLVGFHKVGSGRPCMTWSESVDEALCFGWIDGVRRRIDEHTYSIRFTPRKPSSVWSAVNIAKMEHLQAAGRMTPAGLAAFSHRKADKSAIYSHEQAAVAELPAAQLREFKRHKKAWQFFEAAPAGYRKSMLHWVTSAKRPETRAARFAQLLAASVAGERIDLWTRRPRAGDAAAPSA
ncbi:MULTISPECIES: YdeI family protein [unclassified Acidovorax]|uniref:YdeI/OmpD-associated family protein n=1 Tax=unclassified Acidovorax TaxID=2684926 RepID=UPI001C481A4F|nr:MULTISPECIES: YdeI/OmpD-associated family protein [unclassified Acidovorax]MBV7431404.1 YdeI/OmpD-associated family protein [Acidovorax sp. sif0732]MBV7452553.1 YdeI/OmpD-associated family protein [Acidovorax sp. sif0715]